MSTCKFVLVLLFTVLLICVTTVNLLLPTPVFTWSHFVPGTVLNDLYVNYPPSKSSLFPTFPIVSQMRKGRPLAQGSKPGLTCLPVSYDF